MGLLLDLLADEFPEIAHELDLHRREAALIAAVQNTTTITDTARALVTVHKDGSRSVHPSAALTVPALLDEIDRLRAALPARDDKVAAWIKTARDEHPKTAGHWRALDELLDVYRLHADTGTPLDQHACEGRCCDHCASGGDTTPTDTPHAPAGRPQYKLVEALVELVREDAPRLEWTIPANTPGLRGLLPGHDPHELRNGVAAWQRVLGAGPVNVSVPGNYERLEVNGSYHGVPVEVVALVLVEEQKG